MVPVLSRFYGIIIRMYFLQSEHNPPTFTQSITKMWQPSTL